MITIKVMLRLDDLSGRLAFVRDLLEVSARQASHLVDLSPSMWGLLEGGRKRDPRALTIDKIATHTGIAADWLGRGAGAMFADSTLDPADPAHHGAIAKRIRTRVAGRLSAPTPEPPPTPRTRKPTRARPAAKGPGPVKATTKRRAPKAQAVA
ncbi:MAG: hypothetical protein U0324_29285 [Polyangiales bacterium]